MSKLSYIRGFCKAAEIAGIDPDVLVGYVNKVPIDTQRAADAEQIQNQLDRGGITERLISGEDLSRIDLSGDLEWGLNKYMNVYGNKGFDAMIDDAKHRYSGQGIVRKNINQDANQEMGLTI